MVCPALDLETAAGRLASGGVLILATDTLPGLHARADLPAAVARVRALKGRGETQPLLVLADSLERVRPLLASLTAAQKDACERCWPGPFTLILPAVAPKGGTLAVRIPDHPVLRRLIASAGHPVVSTSVNETGRPASATMEEAVRAFGDRVDGFWPPDGAGSGTAAPSCVVDLTGPRPRVLRPGPEPFPAVGGEES